MVPASPARTAKGTARPCWRWFFRVGPRHREVLEGHLQMGPWPFFSANLSGFGSTISHLLDRNSLLYVRKFLRPDCQKSMATGCHWLHVYHVSSKIWWKQRFDHPLLRGSCRFPPKFLLTYHRLQVDEHLWSRPALHPLYKWVDDIYHQLKSCPFSNNLS